MMNSCLVGSSVTHEVRHHLESLASEDDLEEMDYAEDQNFARREGELFDPFFFRSGTPLGEGAWEVDGDLFVEVAVDARRVAPGDPVVARWPGGELRVPRPIRLGDVHFVYAGEAEGGGERFAVLVRRRGVGEWIRGLLGSARLEVLTTDPAEPGIDDDG